MHVSSVLRYVVLECLFQKKTYCFAMINILTPTRENFSMDAAISSPRSGQGARACAPHRLVRSKMAETEEVFEVRWKYMNFVFFRTQNPLNVYMNSKIRFLCTSVCGNWVVLYRNKRARSERIARSRWRFEARPLLWAVWLRLCQQPL